ncbi:MAG: sporulation transcription factor Spo0A, partial [Lachnospiraceae bacterium]|nr:sporulation transcription factor Spo0A [Lachnospiraceae bacterium]
KPTCVERAIRHAILTTWLYGDQEQINDIFKYCIKPGRDVPSNSVFLARLYYYISNMEYYK